MSQQVNVSESGAPDGAGCATEAGAYDTGGENDSWIAVKALIDAHNNSKRAIENHERAIADLELALETVENK